MFAFFSRSVLQHLHWSLFFQSLPAREKISSIDCSDSEHTFLWYFYRHRKRKGLAISLDKCSWDNGFNSETSTRIKRLYLSENLSVWFQFGHKRGTHGLSRSVRIFLICRVLLTDYISLNNVSAGLLADLWKRSDIWRKFRQICNVCKWNAGLYWQVNEYHEIGYITRFQWTLVKVKYLLDPIHSMYFVPIIKNSWINGLR